MKIVRCIGMSLLVIGIAISCKKKDDTVIKAESAYNIIYGPDAQNVFDVYLPENRSIDSTKIMVLIHGGSWIENNKAYMSSYISRLKAELPNYAFVNLSYRLCKEDPYTNGFPSQEEDVKLALELIKSLAPQWKVSSNITLFGISAGGHLALLQAYKHNSDNSIKAVAAFYPPTNLAEGYDFSYMKDIIELLAGGTPADVPQTYHDSSPVNFASTAIPTILFHGSNDNVVPVQQSMALNDSLLVKGKIVELNVLPVEGHGFSALGDAQSVQKIGQFFKTHNP